MEIDDWFAVSRACKMGLVHKNALTRRKAIGEGGNQKVPTGASHIWGIHLYEIVQALMNDEGNRVEVGGIWSVILNSFCCG